MAATAIIDPSTITLIQSTFLGNINTAFSTIAHYAFNLLYLFAALELVVLGLAWILQRNIGWDKLFFKVIKIGLIFFVIQNYHWILDTIIRSFAQLAGVIIKDATTTEYIFNPAKIWQYGYDVGVHLLQLATGSEHFGLIMILISLGIGILLVFGLLGIQVVVQIVSFYLVSLGALILLPFGAFTPSYNMFDRAARAVLQAGLRLMALIAIIGIAVVVWNGFELTDLATTTNFNINQPLGLFFTALLFLCLTLYLPKIISEAVGNITSVLLDGGAPIITTVRESIATPIETAHANLANMQAATTITPEAGSGRSYEGVTSTAAAATIPTVNITAPASSNIDSRFTKEALTQAQMISKSISKNTVKKIKESVMQAMKEK